MNHSSVHFLKDISFSPLRKIDFQTKINATGRIQFFPNNKRKEVRKVEKSLEHQILVALMACKLEEYLRGVIRDHGDTLKSMDINVKEVGLFGLDIMEEAVATLKTKAQQAKKRQ